MHLSQTKLLLAIDDDTDLQWLRASLGAEGDFVIREVRDGATLRRAVRKTEFDCVIASDNLLEEIATSLARFTLGSPLIIWSSLPDSGRAEQAVAGGAADFLVARETDAVRLVRAVRLAVCRHEADRWRHRPASRDADAIEQLAATVAHGINNPATYVTHNLAFMRDASEAAARMVDELQRLASADAATAADVLRTLAHYDADRLSAELPRLLAETEHGVTRIVDVVKELQLLGDAGIGPDGADLTALEAVAYREREPKPSPESGPLKILVVDDEVLMLSSFRRMLRAHHVTEAHGGQAALDTLAEDPHFDGILCDLMMPHVDGRDFHRALARGAPQLLPRVAYCTAGTFTDGMQAFVSRIANPVLDKPVSPQDILRLCERWRGLGAGLRVVHGRSTWASEARAPAIRDRAPGPTWTPVIVE